VTGDRDGEIVRKLFIGLNAFMLLVSCVGLILAAGEVSFYGPAAKVLNLKLNGVVD